MKSVLLFLAGASLASALARADLTVVQRVDGGGQSGEQTIHVQNGRARCDIGGVVSVIVDKEAGTTTTLVHAQKGYLALTPDRTKAMLEKMQKARASQEPPKLVDMGKKEKIGEYDCEIFTAEMGAVKVTYWLAKDYPDFQKILTELDVLDGAPLAAANNGLAPRTRDLPGMPMKMLMEAAGQKVTITLVSAKEEPADPAIYAIPKSYKELPGPPAAAK